jgi:hypothetical protein
MWCEHCVGVAGATCGVSTACVGVAGATCGSEMSAMMSCWRMNRFEDIPCSKEIQMFLECSRKVVGA